MLVSSSRPGGCRYFHSKAAVILFCCLHCAWWFHPHTLAATATVRSKVVNVFFVATIMNGSFSLTGNCLTLGGDFVLNSYVFCCR